MTRWTKTDFLWLKTLLKKDLKVRSLVHIYRNYSFQVPVQYLGETEKKNKRYTVFSDCSCQELLYLLSLKKHWKVLVLQKTFRITSRQISRISIHDVKRWRTN